MTARLSGLLLALLAVLMCKPLIADDIDLTATPDKCVAMRKGQICYQHVTVKWQGLGAGRYCLMLDKQVTALHCWDNNNSGTVQYPFESAENLHFTLVAADLPSVALARTSVIVAWVYNSKSRRRSTWRLF